MFRFRTLENCHIQDTLQDTSGSSLTASLTLGTQHDRTRAFVQVFMVIMVMVIMRKMIMVKMIMVFMTTMIMLKHNPPCEPYPMCERLFLWRHHVQISCWIGFYICNVEKCNCPGVLGICKCQLLIMMSKYATLSPGFLPSCSPHSNKQTSSQVPLRAKSTGSSGDQGVSWVVDKSFGNFFLPGDERTRQ